VTGDERSRIARAVDDAERGTTGRIAVRVIPDRDVDAFERATHEFGRTGLHLHDGQNAALVLVAPKARKFAIVGDRALHERVGDAFWKALIEETRPHFAKGAFADGVVFAIGRLGEAFRQHFPGDEVTA
jgi:uncharacterized membrane protein